MKIHKWYVVRVSGLISRTVLAHDVRSRGAAGLVASFGADSASGAVRKWAAEQHTIDPKCIVVVVPVIESHLDKSLPVYVVAKDREGNLSVKFIKSDKPKGNIAGRHVDAVFVDDVA